MSLTIAIITLPSNSKRQKLHILRFMIRPFIIERLFCKWDEVFNLGTEIGIHTTLDKNFFRHSFNNSICFHPTSTDDAVLSPDLLIEAL